jgi:hypothetical protein
MNKEKLVIVVRGGVVQSVLSSSLEYPIEVEVLDYDNYNIGEGDMEDAELKEFELKLKEYFPIY